MIDPDLLGKTMEAVKSPAFEEAFRDCLLSQVACDNLVFVNYEDGALPTSSYRWSQDQVVYEEMDSGYLQSEFLLDPAYQIHVERMPPGVYRVDDLAPDQFRRSEYYRRYYKRTTLIDEIVIASHPSENLTVTACLGRDRTSDRRFAQRDIEALTRWAPVYCRLIDMHWQAYGAAREIERVDSGVLAERLAGVFESNLGVALTKRQAEVAILILRGYSTHAMSLQLELSPHTIKVFRKQLYQRCRVSSQAELFSMTMPLLNAL